MNYIIKLLDDFDPQPGTVVPPQQISQIQDASATSICIYCLDQIAAQDKIRFLETCFTKIRYDGDVVVFGVELEEVCKNVTYGYLSLDEARRLLYQDRNHIMSVGEIVKIMMERGLKVINIKINNYEYSIRAKRPTNS